MASNRDPQKDYRINRRGRKVTSSSDRSKRSKKASAPKPTSSSTRSRGKGVGSKKVTSDSNRVTKKPVSKTSSGAQGPRTPPVQGPSKRVSGLIGSRGPTSKQPTLQGIPKVPGRITAKPSAGMKTNSSNLRARGTAALAGAITTGALYGPVSQAKKKASDKKKSEASKSTGKYNTKDSDGTVRSRKKEGPKKVGPKKVGTIAESFDKAFAAAKKAGKSEFTFKGKKYNTQTA